MSNDNLDNCPKCNVTLWGDDIPEESREYYSPPYKWRRELAIEHIDKYDGIWEYECPDCKHRWPSEVQLLKSRSE